MSKNTIFKVPDNSMQIYTGDDIGNLQVMSSFIKIKVRKKSIQNKGLLLECVIEVQVHPELVIDCHWEVSYTLNHINILTDMPYKYSVCKSDFESWVIPEETMVDCIRDYIPAWHKKIIDAAKQVFQPELIKLNENLPSKKCSEKKRKKKKKMNFKLKRHK